MQFVIFVVVAMVLSAASLYLGVKTQASKLMDYIVLVGGSIFVVVCIFRAITGRHRLR